MQLKILLVLAITSLAWSQTSDLVPVISKPISRTVDLPGEFLPFLSVSLHAKVASYVERVLVDRGSPVKKGQLLVELSAPEMKAQIAEAESRIQAATADKHQAEAQVSAAQATYDRLKKAAETPGAVAGNELIQAGKQVDAVQAVVQSREEAVQAAQAMLRAKRDLESYLKITAPFDGVVTDRLVHPGALVGPAADPALLVVQQVSHLRLVVAVPESEVGLTPHGASVPFHVTSAPERVYTGVIARVSRALDPKTRTMPVELDVFNRDGSLAPGMFPTVKWPVRQSRPALFVPKTSVVTTTERVFVIRDRNGHAEWVDVKKGASEGDLIEVIGNLQAGDRVVKRGTDELREGAPLHR